VTNPTSTILPEHFDPDGPAPAESGIYGLPFSAEHSRVVIVPVPFEATTSYGGGTSRGPEAVFEASKQVDLFDHDTGKPYSQGIAMLELPGNVKGWNSEAKKIAAKVIAKGGVVDDEN
jgi:agmatinase